jgi:hypothetical protein
MLIRAAFKNHWIMLEGRNMLVNGQMVQEHHTKKGDE